MNILTCIACDKSLPTSKRPALYHGRPMCDRCYEEAQALRLAGNGVPRWIIWLAVVVAIAVLIGVTNGCSSTPTGLVGGGGDTIDKPWVGDYSSMTTTVYLGADSIEVLVSTQLHLGESGWCSVHVALSTTDPNGAWGDFNTDGLGDCYYAIDWRTVYLTTSIRVVHPGGNFVDRFDATYRANEAWDTLTWLTFHDVTLERVH